MKHQVIIEVKNGEVQTVRASGHTEVIIVDYDQRLEDRVKVQELEDDHTYELGKGHEGFIGHVRVKLREKGI